MQKQESNIDQFEILKKLGEGGFGSVYQIKRKDDGKIYALKKVKMLKLSHKEKENALNEIRILASINSQFIVKYKEAFYNSPSSELCIVMEFADKGDLQGKINEYKKTKGSFQEDLVWEYAAQMLQGIKTLHDMNILHRDLKGANIFLGEEGKTIKLGDLNVSKVQKTNFVHTQTGTPYYLSPEVWKGEPYNNKCDVWSLGCVIYEMVALDPPFKANTMEDLYKKVLKGNYQKIPSKYSSDLSKLISMCLMINPRQRPSINDLLKLPQIASRVSIDFEQQQKQSLMKTMKLPYGGLQNLKNILPKPKYEEKKKEEDQVSKQQTPTENQNVQKWQLQQAKVQRPSSSGPYKQTRSQSQDRPVNYNQPIRTPQTPNKANNSNSSSKQLPPQQQQPQQQQQQQQQQLKDSRNRQQTGQSRPYSQRCSSQERLMDNYNKVNAYQQQYNRNNNYYGYGYGYGQNNQQRPPQQYAGQGNKPPAGQKPPMGNKPPMNPSQQPNPQQSPQPFFGKKKTNY